MMAKNSDNGLEKSAMSSLFWGKFLLSISQNIIEVVNMHPIF